MALEKELRIQELSTSGSKGIKSIDPYGRHNYFAEQMKEVNGSMDGEISGKLRRPKYDEEQLLLAIDTEVDELIPDKPKDLPDVVLQSDYDALRAQLDACLARDSNARVAVETSVKGGLEKGLILLAGEINMDGEHPDYAQIARKTAVGIGYDDHSIGFDASSEERCEVIQKITAQSSNISQGVNTEEQGAGGEGKCVERGYADGGRS